MSEFDLRKDVCFVGLGNSPQCYYRVMLPAMTLGTDWCGVGGDPPRLHWLTGMSRDENGRMDSKMPTLGQYKIVVLQQVAGRGWLQVIRMLQERGIIVVYEVDDYVHGIRHMKGEHDYFKDFDKSFVAEMEACMKKCDAIIASTEFIASNYAHFNENAYVCLNGIDPERYRLSRPPRDTVNIGWAGGTGHNKVVIPWFQRAAQVMRMRPHTCFISIGQNFGLAFEKWFGERRALAVPWAAVEQYPAAMTMFDIALAPGGNGGFFRGKSDLRWLEAGALAIPTIAHPRIYSEIEHGVTGFKVDAKEEVAVHLLELIDDPARRLEVGRQAQEYILENRTMKQMAPQWAAVFEALVEERS